MTFEWSELSDYLEGTLDAEREEDLERELFESAEGRAAAADFLRLVDGIATIRARHGTLSGTLTASALDELYVRGGLFEIPLAAGVVMDCHIPEDFPMCVGILPVSLAGVGRVDVEYLDGRGTMYARACDVAVDRERDRILVACERHVALREEITVFRVVAVEGVERRLLGDFAVRNVPPRA
jgi:hypothetical protein